MEERGFVARALFCIGARARSVLASCELRIVLLDPDLLNGYLGAA